MRGKIRCLRVALIHDWLTGMRGGEKALEVFCEIFPDADLFTLVHLPGTTSPLIERRSVKRSAIQFLPFAGRLDPCRVGLFPFRIPSGPGSPRRAPFEPP